MKDPSQHHDDDAGTVRDAPSRRRAAAARRRLFEPLRRRVRLLEGIVSSSPDFVYVFDREGRVLYANRQLLALCGGRLEEALGKTLLELGFEPWRHELHLGEIARIVDTKVPIDGEAPFVHPLTGERGVCEYVLMPVLGDDGEVEAVTGTTRDITERRRAEQALRDSEERFRLAVQASSLGTFDIDLASRTLSWSEDACRMFGFDDDAAVPIDGAIARIHADDRPRVEAALAAAADPDGSGDYAARYRVTLSDGTQRWIEAVGKGTFVGAGARRRPTRLIGVLRDVTPQQRMIDALRDADQRKDEFLAMLAHELRNPLAPLINAHRLLERTEPLSARGQSTIAMAQRQTRQLQRLVDDLLEVSRITRGAIELRLEPMSIGAAVHDAVEAVAPECEARGHTLLLNLPAQPLRVRADPVRIAQILENLLNNACKYTPDGGDIRIDAERIGDAVEIRVADNGVGIEPGERARLFQLFHQVDTSSDRARGGLGIGLAMVKRLVELHGGTVDCESAGLGRGATFVVRLPVRAPTA